MEVNLAIRWDSAGSKTDSCGVFRSMGPVDEAQQRFTLDCYFRQYWTDPRLAFHSTDRSVASSQLSAVASTEMSASTS